MRTGKDVKEIARLRAGETACELCVLEEKPSVASLIALTDSIILEVVFTPPKTLTPQPYRVHAFLQWPPT